MVASFPEVELGKLFYRRCDNWKTRCLAPNLGSYEAEISLPADCKLDLIWWEANILTSSAPIRRVPSEINLFSDPSGNAWGGVRGTEKTGGMWSNNDKTRHINELELLAALFTLKSLGRDITSLTC